jgi:AcrR family transcriptional regulator
MEPSLAVAARPEARPSQRERLLDAMTTVVAERGYAAATVTDAVRLARVSRGTFYELFASKEDCFLEGYRHGVDVLVERIRGAVRAQGGDWRAGLHAGLRAYLQALAADPRIARAHLFEIHAAGPRAGAQRDATLRRFADRYRASFEAAARERRGLSIPSDAALFVLTAGVDQLVCARVREGALESLPELEDELVTTAVAFLEGATALKEADRPWT